MYRYGRSSNQAGFRSSTPLTNDEIARYAPSVLASDAHESRGDRYAFIPTIHVLDRLRREGFQPFEVRQTNCRDDGKRAFTKHMVRLRHPDAPATASAGCAHTTRTGLIRGSARTPPRTSTATPAGTARLSRCTSSVRWSARTSTPAGLSR